MLEMKNQNQKVNKKFQLKKEFIISSSFSLKFELNSDMSFFLSNFISPLFDLKSKLKKMSQRRKLFTLFSNHIDEQSPPQFVKGVIIFSFIEFH
ncbi:unnamed protein product [Paramecium primaurelia]|uniref:Uncharacterized protein n=1 Tax=Paramecium primaurelia TaxID=5886 RepID=A0A8S1LTT7_PARPR|nr:unnamed protein product [Paramecium primaurelia]